MSTCQLPNFVRKKKKPGILQANCEGGKVLEIAAFQGNTMGLVK